MKQKIRSKRKLLTPKTILRLPDLEVAKSDVLNSLSCPDTQRGYRHAIDEFVEWYCSEPRSSFVRLWSSGTGCIWSLATLPQAPSTFGLEQSGFSHTKLRNAGC